MIDRRRQYKPINGILIHPRYNDGAALGFPENFSLETRRPSGWEKAVTITGFKNPIGESPVTIFLPSTSESSGLRWRATLLRRVGRHHLLQTLGLQAIHDPTVDQPTILMPEKVAIAGHNGKYFDLFNGEVIVGGGRITLGSLPAEGGLRRPVLNNNVVFDVEKLGPNQVRFRTHEGKYLRIDAGSLKLKPDGQPNDGDTHFIVTRLSDDIFTLKSTLPQAGILRAKFGGGAEVTAEDNRMDAWSYFRFIDPQTQTIVGNNLPINSVANFSETPVYLKPLRESSHMLVMKPGDIYQGPLSAFLAPKISDQPFVVTGGGANMAFEDHRGVTVSYPKEGQIRTLEFGKDPNKFLERYEQHRNSRLDLPGSDRDRSPFKPEDVIPIPDRNTSNRERVSAAISGFLSWFGNMAWDKWGDDVRSEFKDLQNAVEGHYDNLREKFIFHRAMDHEHGHGLERARELARRPTGEIMRETEKEEWRRFGA